jgi:hypothetical protein
MHPCAESHSTQDTALEAVKIQKRCDVHSLHSENNSDALVDGVGRLNPKSCGSSCLLNSGGTMVRGPRSGPWGPSTSGAQSPTSLLGTSAYWKSAMLLNLRCQRTQAVADHIPLHRVGGSRHGQQPWLQSSGAYVRRLLSSHL